jgi:tetratricopeptide (TPR) repeat protein
MAEVWQGVHVAQDVPVAVKVMTAAATRDPRYHDYFRQEVHAVAGLDHPGVVTVFDHGKTGRSAEEASHGGIRADSLYLAMELGDRGTLRDHGAGLDWPRLRRVLTSLLEALAHAHARGVIHRDLKPSNVLAFGAGDFPARFKLADFGLAFSLSCEEAGHDFVSGTPTYMAPEQILGRHRDYGPWTDLYSLGCLAWELASGLPPFDADRLQAVVDAHLRLEPPSLLPVFPVPAGFEAWMLRLLRKNPRNRFQRAADAAWNLAALGEAPPGAAVVALDERPTVPELLGSPTSGRLDRVDDGDRAAADDVPRIALGPRRAPPLPFDWRSPETFPSHSILRGTGLGLYGLKAIPFLGREAERDVLWSAFRQVNDNGLARLVLLRGAAGTGKTRLAEWIVERAHETAGTTWLRAVHGPTPGAGDGLARMAARFLRCVGLTPEALLARTEALFRGQGVSDPAEWSRFARMMSSESSAGQTPLSPADRHRLLHGLLRRISRKRPTIVVLEDVQWGADALDFARWVMEARTTEPLPVLFLLTARDEALALRPVEQEAVASLAGLDGATDLEVPPLPADDRHALVRQLLGLSGELAASVEERTGGNPLFAVHLVGDWVQRGVLVASKDGFVLREGEKAALPDDLHQVWSEHIARILPQLPSSGQDGLEIAAALGETLDDAEWREACRAVGIDAPEAMVDLLVANRLAKRIEGDWSFVHGMLRESIERRAREGGRWKQRHEACARMLEGPAERGERGVAERLGRHLLAAGENARAVLPLLRGARERRETSEYAVARSLLERRDEALAASGSPQTDAEWSEGFLLRARIALHEGKPDEVRRWACRAEENAVHLPAPTILAEALRLQGDASRRRGDLNGAQSLYERCVALLPQLQSPHAVAASLWGLGDVARQRGDLATATAALEQSRDLYRAIGDEHGVADYDVGIADVCWQRGDLLSAAAAYERALASFRRLGNRYGVARSLNGLGEVCRAQGDLTGARRLYDEALALLRTIDSAEEIFPRINLGLLELAADGIEPARRQLEEVRRDLEERGWEGLLRCVRTALVACAAAQDGRIEEAREARALAASQWQAAGRI